MPTNDYLVPFGVDPSKFFEGLNAMEAGTDKLANNVKQANQDMAKSFDTAASAGDNLGKKLSVDAQKAQELRDVARTMGKDIAAALDGKNVGQGLEERVKKIKDTITGVGGKNVKLGFDIDTAKLQELEQMIANGADEFRILGTVVDVAKQKLATLDPNSAEWATLNEEIQQADSLLKAFGSASDEVNNKSKSLKAQLREMKAELAAMEMAGKENTQEFLNLSVAAGKVEDQIGDISQRVRVLASDTKYIDAGVQAVTALAGGFAAAQGAAALFGSENEEITKVIQKVTGAMAVLQGIQAIATALNKDSALSVLLFSRAQKTATVSTEALAVAEGEQAAATVAATVATKSWTAALLSNPIFLVVAAVAALVAALVTFVGGSDDAEQQTKDLNDELERQNTLLKLDEGAINRRTNLLVAYAKQQGKTEAEITGIQKQALQDRLKLQQDNLAETRRLIQKAQDEGSTDAETFKKLQDTELEQSENVKNLQNEIQVKGIEQTAQHNKEAKDLEKKRIEDMKRHATEQKAILEQQIKFRKEFNDAFIDSIVDQYEKEKQTAIATAKQRIDQLNAEKALTKEAEQERADAIALINTNLQAKLKEIDRQRETDRAKLLFEGQQKLAELQGEGVEKEVQVLHLGYIQKANEIKEQFKNEGALRSQLLQALNAQEIAETKKIRDTAAREALDTEEKRAELEVETAAKFVGDFPRIEEKKQIEILKVKLDFAVRSLNLLRKQGADENSVEVLQAKKLVQDIQKELGDAVKKLNAEENQFDLFSFLGLKNLSDEQKKAVEDAAQKSLDSVRQITDFISDEYQRQIDAKQKVVDADNKAVDQLQTQLDKEKELRAEGLANNVDGLRAELDAKKQQRDKDIKDQEALQKKQQAIQRAQIVLDTATQASDLITSAANIFKALSSIPFVGVPLAITTIALMTGAFITAKIKAFQAVGESQKFGEGGWIDGKKHSQGGKKYYAADGSVTELEEGEHVTRASQAGKYADLLDAINEDRLSGMNEEALRDMLHEMGIRLNSEEPGEAVQLVKERDAFKHEIILQPANDISEDVRAIKDDVNYLMRRKKNDPHVETKNGKRYETRGTKTVITPIK